MYLRHVGILASLITLYSHFGCALKFNIHGQRKTRNLPVTRRGPGARVKSVELNNTADVSYYVDLTLGGKPYQLLLDTGSSDLWVAGSVPNSETTAFTSGVSYAVSGVKGSVKTAELRFVDHVIQDQAFLEVTPNEANAEGDGILGLGPNEGSNIYRDMNSSAGAAVLDRIFLENVSTPNYVTVLLGRSSASYGGSITIGEVLDGYESILNEPKLPVLSVPAEQSPNQHFQLLLDDNGLFGPDGKAIPMRTDVVSTPNKQQATAVIDTGFSFPQLPEYVAAAIYGRFRGAELMDIGSIGRLWTLPCSQEVNITFMFSGKRFPIHPLDVTIIPETIGLSNLMNPNGQKLCLGTFQPFSYNTGSSPTYDMVLGMAFLRNAYILMDYGDFILNSTNKGDPYMQFLSLTNPAKAHTDFVKMRLNGVDTTGDSGLLERGKSPHALSHAAYYIIAGAVVLLILLGVVIFVFCRARKRAKT